MPSTKLTGKSKEDLTTVAQLSGLLSVAETAHMTRSQLLDFLNKADQAAAPGQNEIQTIAEPSVQVKKRKKKQEQSAGNEHLPNLESQDNFSSQVVPQATVMTVETATSARKTPSRRTRGPSAVTGMTTGSDALHTIEKYEKKRKGDKTIKQTTTKSPTKKTKTILRDEETETGSLKKATALENEKTIPAGRKRQPRPVTAEIEMILPVLPVIAEIIKTSASDLTAAADLPKRKGGRKKAAPTSSDLSPADTSLAADLSGEQTLLQVEKEEPKISVATRKSAKVTVGSPEKKGTRKKASSVSVQPNETTTVSVKPNETTAAEEKTGFKPDIMPAASAEAKTVIEPAVKIKARRGPKPRVKTGPQAESVNQATFAVTTSASPTVTPAAPTTTPAPIWPALAPASMTSVSAAVAPVTTSSLSTLPASETAQSPVSAAAPIVSDKNDTGSAGQMAKPDHQPGHRVSERSPAGRPGIERMPAHVRQTNPSAIRHQQPVRHDRSIDNQSMTEGPESIQANSAADVRTANAEQTENNVTGIRPDLKTDVTGRPEAENRAKRPLVETGDLVSGVLEIMPDGYGFLRKDNYLQGTKDIYVPPQYIRRFNLRTGDLIAGPSKMQRDTDRYQALLYIKEVNGLSPEKMIRRPAFDKLTPIYPDVRYKLETIRNELSTRIIDLMAPIGRGQRGMIVSPPKAGKTILLQKIANAISLNNPEVKLIVLLIDERPEEVTDMQRSINGEVVYSTFDKTPENHVKVTELVLERAMRLVELQQDVVILLDSMTRLARAYNLTINPTGRTLSGGLDPGALYGPKRFFGSARNIEDGGSLTIIATSLIETGSRMDEVIFEEFKGTGNMEVYLDRKLSEKRIFPAIDINRSGTRREELLLTTKELDAVWTIRKAFGQLDTANVTETVINLLLKTQHNEQFISSINVSFNDKNVFEAMRGVRPNSGNAANGNGGSSSFGNGYNGGAGNYRRNPNPNPNPSAEDE